MTQTRFLERARKRLGLTQVGFAEMLDVNKRTVIRWENDQSPLPRIARYAILYLLTRRQNRRKIETELKG